MHHLQFCWLLLPWLPFLCPSLNIATTVRITHDVQYPSGNSCHSCYSYSKETNLLMEWTFWIAEPNSILLGTKACCDISFRISKNHLSVTCSAKCLCTPDDVECLEMLTAAFWADRLRIPSLATDETCLRTMPSPTLLTTRVVDVGRFFRIKLHRSRLSRQWVWFHHELYLRIFCKLLSPSYNKSWDQHEHSINVTLIFAKNWRTMINAKLHLKQQRSYRILIQTHFFFPYFCRF